MPSHERNESAMFRTPAKSSSSKVSSQSRSVVCLPSGVYIILWKLEVGVSIELLADTELVQHGTYHDICQFMTKLP